MLRRLFRGGSRLAAAVKLSVLVAALAVAPEWVSAEEEENGPRLEGVKRLDMPQEIVRAADVRWAEDGQVVLSVIGPGIHTWRVGESGAELRIALEEPADEVREEAGRVVVNRNTFERDYGRLAVSPLGIAFADQFAGIHVANEDGIRGPVAIEFLGDLDRRGSLTAAVGLMRADEDGWAPYGAWLVEDGGGLPRGLLPTRDAGRGLELCRDAELSVIRFISEDRLLVIPGAEAGVFVYGLDGVIHDGLDSATFHAESGCDVEPNEWGRSPLFDAYVRADWLGPRRIIDEVVADGEGNVYFFVRYRSDGAEDRVADDVGMGVRRGVPLLASLGAGILAQGPLGSQEPGRPRSQEQDGPRGQVVNHVNVRGGAVSDRVVASVPPPSGRVCWDLVHTRVDDLRASSLQPCVIESEFADTRLRADLRRDRAVILLRGGALRGADVREAEAFEARLLPPAGSGD